MTNKERCQLRFEMIQIGEAMGVECPLSEDQQWLIAGPFKTKEFAQTFASVAERFGLATDNCGSDFQSVKFR